MIEIGHDNDGYTEQSLEALTTINKKGFKLEKIYIYPTNSPTCKTLFIFKTEKVYFASGFSIGYGGQGPHGLHKAIQLFYPNSIEFDFWDSDISTLGYDSNWEWTPEKGFISI